MDLKLSKPGGIVAGIYLLIAILALLRLVLDGYIGHGNAIEFLLTIALTSPLSFLLLMVDDVLTDTNRFHMTGWPYYRTLCELAAGALLNAALLHTVVAMIKNKAASSRAN
jgi:hypothetical protein